MAIQELSPSELQSRLEYAITSYSPEAAAAALNAGADPTKRIFKDQVAPLIFVCALLTEERKTPVLKEPEAEARRDNVIKKLEVIISVLEEHLMIYLGKAIAEHNIIRVAEVLEAGANPAGLINGQTTPLEYARHALDEMENTRAIVEHAAETPRYARKRKNAIKDLKEIIILLEMRVDLAAGSDKLQVLRACTDPARKLCNGDRSKPEKLQPKQKGLLSPG